MNPETPIEPSDSLREYLGVLARHKLVVILSALATAAAAFAYSTSQTPLYEASAAVLITPGGAGSVLSELPGLAPTNDPERRAATNVNLARLPLVARRTGKSVGLHETPVTFLGRSSVSAEPDADILRFSVRDAESGQAEQLATAYANAFTHYRNQLDVQAIRSTRATISRTLARLAAGGQRRSALYAELRRAVRRLDAAEAVQGSAAVVVQPAINAVQVQPQTRRNVVGGFALGLVYGIGLAFLLELFDKRVRTPEQVEEFVGLPVLGELPRPPDLSKHHRSVSMLDFPHGPYAESVRKLRANLEFAELDVDVHTLMVTSAVEGDGKTTVAADLAVAFARSGRSVALCDLDARAPGVDRAFGLGGRRGLVDVALGLDSLDRVLVSISWATAPGGQPTVAPLATSVARDDVGDLIVISGRRAGKEGELHVLPFGSRRPRDPGDFVGSIVVQEVVADLAKTHDIVIVDTAPLLPVSDARVVSEYVDAALIVSGLKTARRPDLRSVRRLVPALPIRVLGVAVTGAPPTSRYGSYGAP